MVRRFLVFPLFCPIHIYHHHHIVLAARISLTLSRHSSLSFIALGRSSGQQPVSSHSCWMYVRAGRPAFARPCVGIHKSTSLMSSSLLLQQCPACLVRLYIYIFELRNWCYIFIELPCLENSVNTYMRNTEHCTAVSTLLGLISSAYRDLHHWRSNQQPQNAASPWG